MKLVKSQRAVKRILTETEVHEYIQVELEFDREIYTQVCEDSRGLYISIYAQCALCPTDCFLAAYLQIHSIRNLILNIFSILVH